MRLSHAALVAHEARFPTGHRKGYDGFAEAIATERARLHADFLASKTPRQPTVNELIAAFGDLPPRHFAAPYDLSPQDLDTLSRSIQRKYILRFKNIRRSWAILLQHMPELMAQGAPSQHVLEMSTGHGATLEILRDRGHTCVGNDYPNFLGKKSSVDTRFRAVNEFDLAQEQDDHGLSTPADTTRDWPYRPIIESLGLDVRLFDGGCLPYPLDDKSFDTILCMDAIEHYAHPRDWLLVIAEFTRIARRSVLLIINPVQPQLLDDAEYVSAFRDFQREMRSYDKAGFACVHAGINRNQLTAFKLRCLTGA